MTPAEEWAIDGIAARINALEERARETNERLKEGPEEEPERKPLFKKLWDAVMGK
jgi:hypothetical protein